MVSDLYKSLGVAKTASADEIKKAYRKLARKHHPDVNQGKKASEEKFKEVSAAFAVLSDPDKRALYDELGEDAIKLGFDPEKVKAYREYKAAGAPRGGRGPRQAPPDFGFPGGGGGAGFGVNLEDLLGDLMGRSGGRRRSPFGMGEDFVIPQDGADVEASITLALLDALRGGERDIVLERQGGEPTRLHVRIPAGVDEGQKVRLKGQGMPGVQGGASGDLLLTVHIDKHPFLRREGDDLYLEVPVTIGEALLGGKIDVPTLDGPVKLTIPPRSQSGRKLRVKGKGVPARKGREPGDLYVTLAVRVPDQLAEGDEARQAIAELEKHYSGELRAGLRL